MIVFMSPIQRSFRFTFGVLIALCGVFSAITSPRILADENLQFRDNPVSIQSNDERQQNLIEIQAGMTLDQVRDQLGPPEFESVIGSLKRARVTYSNDTELLFDDDQLIGIKTSLPPRTTTDQRSAIEIDESLVVFAPSLRMTDSINVLSDSDRKRIDEEFLFGGSFVGTEPYDVHFTPALPQCLLDNCPGCERCQSCSCGKCPTGRTPACTNQCALPRLAERGWNLRASIDALFLARDADAFAYTIVDSADSAMTPDASHGLTPGFAATAAFNLTGANFVEATYLGGHSWSADSYSADIIPASASTIASSGSYNAEMEDIQIIWVHHQFGRPWSVLWGVRYSEHSDEIALQLDGQIAGPPITARNPIALSASAQNRLFGLQAGGRYDAMCGPVRLHACLKAGAFHNEMTQRGPLFNSAVDLSGNPAALPTFSVDDESVSFLGDFELSLRYNICAAASIRLGYQGLILSDLALVAEQNGRSASSSTLSYNGIFGGIEVRH